MRLARSHRREGSHRDQARGAMGAVVVARDKAPIAECLHQDSLVVAGTSPTSSRLSTTPTLGTLRQEPLGIQKAALLDDWGGLSVGKSSCCEFWEPRMEW